jgi:hypothetical protein
MRQVVHNPPASEIGNSMMYGMDAALDRITRDEEEATRREEGEYEEEKEARVAAVKSVRGDGLSETLAQFEMMRELAEGKYRPQGPCIYWPTDHICMARKVRGLFDVMQIDGEGKASYLGRLEKLPE